MPCPGVTYRSQPSKRVAVYLNGKRVGTIQRDFSEPVSRYHFRLWNSLSLENGRLFDSIGEAQDYIENDPQWAKAAHEHLAFLKTARGGF